MRAEDGAWTVLQRPENRNGKVKTTRLSFRLHLGGHLNSPGSRNVPQGLGVQPREGSQDRILDISRMDCIYRHEFGASGRACHFQGYHGIDRVRRQLLPRISRESSFS